MTRFVAGYQRIEGQFGSFIDRQASGFEPADSRLMDTQLNSHVGLRQPQGPSDFSKATHGIFICAYEYDRKRNMRTRI